MLDSEGLLTILFVLSWTGWWLCSVLLPQLGILFLIDFLWWFTWKEFKVSQLHVQKLKPLVFIHAPHPLSSSWNVGSVLMKAGLCVFIVTVYLAKLVWMCLVLLVIIYCFVYVMHFVYTCIIMHCCYCMICYVFMCVFYVNFM